MDCSMDDVSCAASPCRQASVRKAQNGVITLRGSTDRVAEFFFFAVNSILFQTGIYPAESFTSVKKYWNPLLVTKDPALNEYLGEVIGQVKSWMHSSEVKKLVVVISDRESGESLQRWVFELLVDRGAAPAGADPDAPVPETQAEKTQCQREIGALLRQITSTVSFLPAVDPRRPCNFDVLIYTDKQAEVPRSWAETDPKYISGECEEVRLRSFATKIHTVEGGVEYKLGDC